MTALTLAGVAKRFGSVAALQHVDLEVADGSLVAVLGPSGCGKTTMLRVIAGFERPDAGTVHLGGRLVAGQGVNLPPERRRIGLVPQESALFPHLDVAGNVGFGLPRGERAARVGQLLELVGLVGYERRRPYELSGGEQARVALARALAPEPSLVLLDEPFAALDAGLRAEVRDDVRRVLHETGATGVLVTHDQEEALSVADQVAVMRFGRVVQAASPLELYTQPADLEVARFVGAAVELPATAGAGSADTPLGVVHVPSGASGVGVVLVRPEQIVVSGEGVRATVQDVVFHGHDALLRVELAGGRPVMLRVMAPVTARPGDAIHVSVAGHVQFFPETPELLDASVPNSA